MKQINIKEFIEKVEDEFPEMPKGQLTPETKFRENMEWDSVNALMFVVLVNVEYDVTLVADEFINAETIQDIFNIIKNKVEENELAVQSGKLASDMSEKESRKAFGELSETKIAEDNN